jgi:stress-induced morphogen
MISKEAIAHYIKQAIPDAEVAIVDKTGTMDHYRLQVVSPRFQGMNLLDRQRLVYETLSVPMKDGRIHALEIRSQTPQEAEQ